MALFWILAILFAALFIIVPLIEKFGPRMEPEELRKYSRFFLPLSALIALLAIIGYMFRA